jgi:hypothetical protein
MARLLFCILAIYFSVARAEPCEMIDDPAGYRYLECDPQKAKAAKEAAALAAATTPPKKPGWAQSVEEFKANMEAESGKSETERAAAKAKADAIALEQGTSTGDKPAESTTPPTALCTTSNCGPVYVKGYTRKDGTYVRPHTRSR